MSNKTTYTISALAQEINRKDKTIRKWEAEGKLPKKLLPKRTKGGHRYWTAAQVRDIKKWMKSKDMRPGNLLVHPNDTDDHIKNLRRPKFIGPAITKQIISDVNEGYNLEYILETYKSFTGYSSKENFEKALRKWFDENGWELPEYEEEITLDKVRKVR